jgi:hypothetical protein
MGPLEADNCAALHLLQEKQTCAVRHLMQPVCDWTHFHYFCLQVQLWGPWRLRTVQHWQRCTCCSHWTLPCSQHAHPCCQRHQQQQPQQQLLQMAVQWTLTQQEPHQQQQQLQSQALMMVLGCCLLLSCCGPARVAGC